MSYLAITASDKGAVRSNNQDCVVYGEIKKLKLAWFLIADGMGGHRAGEVASELLATSIKNEFARLEEAPQSGWPDWIKRKFYKSHFAILKAANENDAYQGMGTTGVLMVLDQNDCYLGWVGDSRAYLFRNNELSQLTEDHTMLQSLVNKGAISAKEAEDSNSKHLLLRAIGVKEDVDVDTLSIQIEEGDCFFLSSDGIHDYLRPQVIEKYLRLFEQGNMGEQLSSDMIGEAIAQESNDNLSLALVKVQG